MTVPARIRRQRRRRAALHALNIVLIILCVWVCRGFAHCLSERMAIERRALPHIVLQREA